MTCCNGSDSCSHRDQQEIQIEGIPKDVPNGLAEMCKARLREAIRELMELSGMEEVQLRVGNVASPKVPQPRSQGGGTGGQNRDEVSIEERAEQYQSRKPFFDFDFLVVPEDLRESLLSAIDLVTYENLVFDQWNLRSIEPFPRTALNLHGPPGTGKTLAAHALASYVQRPILMANYGQVESKFVGDGAKNVEALFFAAERDEAVLFIDEADSLLSRRLTNVTQGAEQAINSMRSQLLVCLEHFRGVVIFSTNLVENYDRAFETRVRNLYFPLPDYEARLQIWKRHLPAQLPLHQDVSIESLAKIEDVCGRDIKSAVLDAALRAARMGKGILDAGDLESAMQRVKQARVSGLDVGVPVTRADP